MSHAAQRALEHYGIRLTPQKLGRIRKRILDRDPTVLDLGPQRDDARLIAVLYGDIWLAAVVANDSFIVTFLTPHRLKNHSAAICEREVELMRLELEGQTVL